MSVTEWQSGPGPADQRPAGTAVLLCGTGSDDVFVRAVFQVPLEAVGVRMIAPVPRPGAGLAEAQLARLDQLADDGPILVGGISLGAHLAAQWAWHNRERCAGLLLALPGWIGSPDGAPAAAAARASAAAVRSLGVAGALDAATANVPPWLNTELRRAWTGYGDGLADSLEASATLDAPTEHELAGLAVPVGVAGCIDDQIHPLPIAKAWAAALPTAVLCTTRLSIVGADPEALGRAAVLAWLRAGGRPVPIQPG